MSEVSLLVMFEADRGVLAARLAAGTSADALRCIRDYLEDLADRYMARDGAASGSGSAARDVIEAVRSSFGALRALQLPAAAEPLTAPDPDQTPHKSSRFGLLSKTVEFIEDGWVDREEPPPPEPEVVIEVRGEYLLDSLAAALEAADRAMRVEAPAEHPKSEPVRWADDSELMDLVHDLVAARARNSSQELLLRVGLLMDELRLRHDIRTVTYDGANPEYFEFLDSPNPTDDQVWTRSPALVAGTCLIRRGEVRCPRRRAAPARSALKPEKDTP
jgi:hypothetical protein